MNREPTLLVLLDSSVRSEEEGPYAAEVTFYGESGPETSSCRWFVAEAEEECDNIDTRWFDTKRGQVEVISGDVMEVIDLLEYRQERYDEDGWDYIMLGGDE